MPFVYDYSQVEWPDDDGDLPPPRVSEFVYLPAPEYGGVHEPAHFTLDVPPEPAVVRRNPVRMSLWDRLLGRRRPAEQVRASVEADMKAQMARGVFSSQRLFATTVPVLRALGVKQLYGRYDGGNDEGFSWLDNALMRDGTRIDADTLAQRLMEQKFLDELTAKGVMKRIDRTSELDQVRSFIRDWMCTEWANLLLGGSYGTGEYVMYGAFVVDLDDCTVIDDPKADPVVSNIEITG
ncbi:hypothetical protein [Bradyrhizobium commune]|uniref:Uncharacterized protein n=1 Tax=Bradyrhizobium commune TaxID=83627 RepID=A0A7S9D915_9BRAD|nr:hypothetical protein [Bradyrhizobium commune]QPF93401.1 hypothetical protein IC761_09070 [Bradyrhizobium commune]